VKKEGIEVATQVATMIRARIKEVTGLNASAGISYCEFLTKIASDLNKPNAQAVITPRMGPILSSSKRFPREQTSHRFVAARLELGAAIPTSAGRRSNGGAFSGRSIAFHLRHDERAG
jgi:impB/mucB/samB family